MKKICAMLLALMLLVSACSAVQPSSKAPDSTAGTEAPETTAESTVPESETEEPTTPAPPKNEIIVWTLSGEEERTKTICEYYLGKPQQAVPAPEGGWIVTVKSVPAEDLISRMQEATDTSFTEGVLPDIEEMPDLYFFYSDDYDTLRTYGLLSAVPEKSADEMSRKMVPAAVEAAGGADGLYAYPAAIDHSLLLYYDKSVVTDVSDLAAVIGQCGEAGRCFYVGTETTTFASTVFLSYGLTYEPVIGSDGRIRQIICDYYSENGLAAARQMKSLMSMDAFRAMEGSPVLAFSFEQDQAAAMIAASYQTTELRAILGDDYGVAALPPILDGETAVAEVARGTFTMVGVAPKKDENKRLVCHALAAELTSAASQRARFDADGTIPVREAVLTEDLISNNKTASALVEQMPNVVRKIRVTDGYFAAMDSFTEKLLAGGEDMKTAKIQQLLDELSAFLMYDIPKAQE